MPLKVSAFIYSSHRMTMTDRNEEAGHPDSHSEHESDSDDTEHESDSDCFSVQGIEVGEAPVSENNSAPGNHVAAIEDGPPAGRCRLRFTKVNSPGACGGDGDGVEDGGGVEDGLDMDNHSSMDGDKYPYTAEECETYLNDKVLPELNECRKSPDFTPHDNVTECKSKTSTRLLVHGSMLFGYCHEKSPNAPVPALRQSLSSGEVEVMQVINTLQLPHARDECLNYPFVEGDTANNRVVCNHCWCRICQIPTAECTEWLQHCNAADVARRGRNRR
jgi:hypothetical protein